MTDTNTLEAIRRDLSGAVPNDRKGGLLTLAQERWLFEQLASLQATLDEESGYGARMQADANRLQEQLEAVRHAMDLLDRGIIEEPGAIASVRAALYPASEPEAS